jgi:hypothetical protein
MSPRTIRSRTVNPLLAVAPDVTIVTQVNLVIHVSIALRIMNCVITPVPRSTIVYLLDIGDTVIDFLYISLEVAVVLECLILSHDRLRVLVKPVSARREGSTACHQKQ